MTNQEWHVRYDVYSRRLNSNRRNIVRPEEKDLVLNRAILEVISAKLDNLSNVKAEGILDYEKHISELRDVIKIKEGIATHILSDDKVYAILPNNCIDVLSSESIIGYDCEGLISKTEIVDLKYVVLPFANDVTDQALYEDLLITIDGVDQFNRADYVTSRINRSSSKFILVNTVLDIINSNNAYSIYWERYDDIYVKDNFIVIKNDGDIVDARLVYQSFDSTTIASSTISYNNYVESDSKLTKPNRLVGSEYLPRILNHAYSRTMYSSPVSTIVNGELRLFNNSTFDISAVNITYVEAPIRFNFEVELAPNVSSERLIDEIVKHALSITIK